MKSTEYQIQTAINIADNDENAFVGVFFHTYEEADATFDISYKVFTKGMLWRGLSYLSNCGGKVRFFASDVPENLGGIQITHAVITESVKHEVCEFIESRVRTASVTKEPIGTYYPWGKRVWVDY